MKWVIGGIASLVALGAFITPASTVSSSQSSGLNAVQPTISNDAVSTKSHKRYKVQVTLTSLADLKVKTGDRVEAGQVLSDRVQARSLLEAKRRQLEISIKQMSLPLTPSLDLPSPNYAVEENAIARAKFEMAALDKAFVPDTRFKAPVLEQIYDKDILEKRAKLQETKARAAMELSNAIASLEKARADYQQRQYQHSLNLIQHQTNMQRQQYELASLMAQQEDVDAKLREIVAVTSPYSGKVRRVKITGQTDRNITAEIMINVEKAAE
jgi:multidrug efflux pump subunit AcrA (membrane-fusion protein)